MPGTTRYSATFDRPYEEEDEEDLPAVPPLTRRSRSASWQATTANGRPYTPLGGSRGSHARSASTDNGPQSPLSSSPAQSTERIPTRTTGKVSVKTSHNPFQFVKVGSCSLYKKAEEQLKKTQKIKQPEALKEEEEEWQTNLDSWKSRRRKMSQDVFRRQEEMKELLEMEEQQPVGQQKKVKTFSEMLEERASRGRTLSLCLYSNPLGLDEWGLDNGKNDSEMSCNDTHQSSGSAESSNANSEDENDVFQSTQMTERNGVKNVNNTQRTRRTGAVHFLGNHNGVNNGISLSTDSGNNCDFKVSDLALSGEMLSDKCEPCQSGAFNDSGLDSLSSSHRAGDIPDSGSDFSQDSGSSLDCDSPGITGIPTSGTELLQEFSSKDSHPSNGMLSNKEKIDGMELCLKLTLTDSKFQQYGFTINGGKDKGSPVTVASVINGSVSDLVGLKTGDHILAINKEDISTFSHSAVISSLKLSAESRQLELLLWRPASADVKQEKSTLNGSPPTTKATSENSPKKPVPQQPNNKDPINKAANGATTKDLSVTESSVDNKADIVDSQSNNKKSTPAKQKDLNNKASAPPKSQKQEITTSTVETTKNRAEAVTAAENQNGKSVESENEMFVDDLGGPPASNSKIPVAEKSPKIMGKKISKASQETKKNKSVVSDSIKNNESSTKTKDSSVEDSKDNSLNIIYQSQPSAPKAGSKAKEPVTAQLEHSASSSVDKKVVNESSKSPAQTPTNKQESKFNDKLTFEATEILPVDQVAEQMERLILEQLEEEERLKEKPETLHDNVDSTTAGILLQEHELNSIDTPPRQAEPPKEKPPPPPTSSSCTNKDSPLKRVNSTKRIKKEIQKRRSDFLGIEKPEEEERTIPPPPDLENILKLECEQERKVREILGKESLHQRESSFEEEIARKEREIIESLETEERMKMAKQTVADENVSSSSSDTSFSQVEVERIKKLQEERVRMEEERFLKEEQQIRLEEERQLREREEQIRREEAPKAVKDPVVFPAQSEGSANNTSKQKDMPSSNDVGNISKTSKNDSDPKILPTVSNVPSVVANSCAPVCDVNKKQTLVKKTKAENKKSKADKQNIGSKTENKTAAKSETNGQNIGSTSDNKIAAKSDTNGHNVGSKLENKTVIKLETGGLNIASKSEGKTVVKSETNGQNIGSKSEKKTSAKSETSGQNIGSKSENKTDAKSETSGQNIVSKSESKTDAKSETNGENISLKSEDRTAVKSEKSGLNIGSKYENKTAINSEINATETQIAQSENIPATTEKEVVLNSKSTKVCKSSEVSQNIDPHKIITSQNEISKSDACSTKQKSKATGASKNMQPNKPTASQDEITKVDKKKASELKPKEYNISQNVKQNKDTAPQGEGLNTTVPKQRSDASQVPTNHLNGDVKSKVSVSKQKLQASENCQNVHLNEKKASFDGNKCAPAQQICNLQNQEQNKPQQTTVTSKLCTVEQNSSNLEASQNIETNKKTILQSVDRKPKNISKSGSEVPQSPQTAKTDQNTMLNCVDVKPNCTSDNKTKLLQNNQNVEQKQTAPLTEDIHSKTLSTEQKSKNVKTSSNGKQIKMKDLQDNPIKSTNSAPVEKPLASETLKIVEKKQSTLPVELHSKTLSTEQKSKNVGTSSNGKQIKMKDLQDNPTKSTNSAPVEKPLASETLKIVEKKQSTLPVELPNNKMSAPEQKCETSLTSQCTEIEKHTAPQAEVPKTNKSVPEQKPAGNMVRVRKKKKGQSVKPIQLENANTGVNCPESSNQNKKCPVSPTTPSKPEDKTGNNVLPDKQSKENVTSVSDNKVDTVNFVAPKLPAASESECSKLSDQKSIPVSGISPSISTVVENMPESKASSNLKMENASDAITSSVLTSNSESTAPISSISSSVSSDASLSQTGGGKNMENVCMKSASDDQSNIANELTNNLVATKPLKKKEVIRKERERLRQEQEALQREREEYRRQMMKEQELLKDSQKSHAPDAPVSRAGAPPPLKPALPLPLTSLPHASQALKENVSYTSRSLPTNSVNNAAVGNHNTVGTSQSSSLLSPSHNNVARSKVTQNEAWGPHKVPVVKKQPDVPSESRYNQNHWLIQEAEMRRISEQKERQQRAHPSGDPRCGPMPFNQGQYHPMHVAEENFCGGVPCALQKPPAIPGVPSLVNKPSSYPVPTQMHSPEQQWNYGQPIHPTPQGRKFPITNVLSPGTDKIQPPSSFSRNARVDPSLQAPTKPSRVIPMDRQEQMLSVSGRKRCSHCGEELGRGAAMIIESLQLYYHIQCFRCCVCQAQLGNGSCGTDVRVRNNKLHCHNCYSNDEAGLKFSQV